MIYLLLIILSLVVIFCLYLAVACIFAAGSENALPDLEDIEAGKRIS